MPCSYHIHRRADWWLDEDPSIQQSEWDSLVDADPELERQSESWVTNPSTLEVI